MKGISKNPLKRNYQVLIEQGRETRFGPQWKGIRCGAKTRRGTPCLKPAIKHKTRCQLHGGRSIGARTVKNRANNPSSTLGSVCSSRRRDLIREEYERNEDLPKEFWLDKTIAHWVIKL